MNVVAIQTYENNVLEFRKDALADTVAMLSAEAQLAYDRGDLSDVVYTDDTLLISSSGTHLNEYLRAAA